MRVHLSGIRYFFFAWAMKRICARFFSFPMLKMATFQIFKHEQQYRKNDAKRQSFGRNKKTRPAVARQNDNKNINKINVIWLTRWFRNGGWVRFVPFGRLTVCGVRLSDCPLVLLGSLLTRSSIRWRNSNQCSMAIVRIDSLLDIDPSQLHIKRKGVQEIRWKLSCVWNGGPYYADNSHLIFDGLSFDNIKERFHKVC